MGPVGYAVLAFGLAWWVLPVPLTLLHELGHALPALAFGGGRVTVTIGWQPTRVLRIGRLELRIRLLNHPRWAWYGHVDVEGDDQSRGQAVVVLLGGPLVTALVLAILLLAAALVPWPPVLLVWAGALPAAWQLIVTAVPMRYPRWFGPYAGRVSDGYRVVRLFR